MKKLIAIISVVALIATLFVMAVPAAAAEGTVPVTVTVAGGGGGNATAPLVKAKWESSDSTVSGETGDPNHATAMTQIAPIAGFQGKTYVSFWAVVAWNGNVQSQGSVYADVYYPATGTTDPGANGSKKFEIPLTLVGTSTAALPYWNEAIAVAPTPIVTINDATPVWPTGSAKTFATQAADVKEELTESQASLYYGIYYFDNCELAGTYTVTINAMTNGSINLTGSLTNPITWMPLTMSDYDFGSINYSYAGPVAVGADVSVGGDQVWDLSLTGATPSPNPATIRNIGNTYLQMLVKEDDLGMGITGDTWNVRYDVRLGNAAPYTLYNPVVFKGGNLSGAAFTVVGVVNSTQILRLCAQEKIDFSIHIVKDPGPNHVYSGSIVLGSQSATATPDVGVETGYTTLPPITPIAPATR